MKLRSHNIPPLLVIWGVAQSPVGELVVGLAGKGICRVAFLRGKKASKVVQQWSKEWPKTTFEASKAKADIKTLAKIPVLTTGTEFQSAVWRAIAKIPAGKTLTYTDIAEKIGRPKAVRAVGKACGANPVPFFVPCHRVVGANGGLGGFSGGLDIKKALLKIEKAHF